MYLRRFVVVSLIVVLGSGYTNAFTVDNHEEITRAGLTAISLKYSLSPDIRQALNGRWFTDEAIQEIVNANKSRDLGDCSKLDATDDVPVTPCDTPSTTYQGIVYSGINAPIDHFDDETFVETNSHLKTIRDTVVKDLMKGSFVAARRQLGYSLHTLQDFYAHSNWVELKLGVLAEDLGTENAFFLRGADTIMSIGLVVAGKNEPTCPDSPSALATDHLTSGYFPNNRSEIPQYKKCAHGIPVSTTVLPELLTPYAVERGINKDSVTIYRDVPLSDRYARHEAAMNAAQNHTINWVKGIFSDGCGTDVGCLLGFMGYPQITSLNPTGADATNGPFTLHVMGAGFTENVANSQPTVLWNGKPLQTTLTDVTGGTKLDARVDNFNFTAGPVKISVKQFEVDSNGNVTSNVLESNAVDFNLTTPKLDCAGAIRPHYHDERFMDVDAVRWNDTGRMVKAGEMLSIQVVPQGWVVWRSGGLLTGATGEAQPQGDTRATPNNTLLWVEPPMPIGVAPIGALIGMVVDKQHLDGNGNPTMPLIEKPDGVKWFRILTGGQFMQPVPIDGRLYLGINDGAFFNNGGCFQVRFLK